MIEDLHENCFSVSVAKGVAHIQLSRPDALNVMTPELWRQYPQILADLDRGGNVRAAVISSQGKHFCAGMDISVFETGALAPGTTADASDRERLLEVARFAQDALSAPERVRFPVIAAIQGGCIGGALDLVCACDLRVASSNAYFLMEETNIALMSDIGGLQRLPHLMAYGVAVEVAMLAERLSAERAYHTGFVNFLADTPEGAITTSLEIAGKLAAKSPLALRGIKDALLYARDHPVADAMSRIRGMQGAIMSPDEMIESIRARQERRTPQYADLKKLPDSF